MKVKAIVLGAGMGSRMHSDLPKVMHPISGKPMIQILLNSIQKAGISDITVVIGPNMDMVKQAVKPAKTAVQTERLGTANAVLAAEQELEPFEGCVLVLYGDTPLISADTMTRMIMEYKKGSDITVLGFLPSDARRYGRLVMGKKGLEKVVEYKDATDAQRAIKLCNSGVMCFNGKYVLPILKQIKNRNAAGEYYLTDSIEIACKMGLTCDVVIGDVEELHGVNTTEELETAQEIYNRRQGDAL